MAFTLCLSEEERLAEVIKTYPCLYDKSSKGYKEKDVVANAWNDVAEQLEFVENGKRAQACFTNLKKKYTRKKKDLKDLDRSGTSAKALERAQKSFDQYQFMHWIDTFIQPRDGRTNLKRNHSNTDKEEASVEENQEEVEPSQDTYDNIEDDDQSSDEDEDFELSTAGTQADKEPKTKKPRKKLSSYEEEVEVVKTTDSAQEKNTRCSKRSINGGNGIFFNLENE